MSYRPAGAAARLALIDHVHSGILTPPLIRVLYNNSLNSALSSTRNINNIFQRALQYAIWLRIILVIIRTIFQEWLKQHYYSFHYYMKVVSLRYFFICRTNHCMIHESVIYDRIPAFYREWTENSQIGINRSKTTRYLMLLITCFDLCVNYYVWILRRVRSLETMQQMNYVRRQVTLASVAL